MYPQGVPKPKNNRSVYPAHRCAHAINDQRGDFSFHDVPAEQVRELLVLHSAYITLELQVCLLKWPTRLVEDAQSLHGYQNEAINNVLEDVFPIAVEIASGTRASSVMDDFKAIVSRTGDQIHRGSDFHASLRFPLLPGDRSLMDPFIIRLQRHLAQDPNVVSSAPRNDTALVALGVGSIIFSVAILRYYLGRRQEDDGTIYALITGRIPATPVNKNSEQQDSARPRIVRQLTVPEQALATALQLGPADWTEPNITSQLMFEQYRIKHVKSFQIEVETPMAYILSPNGVPFHWPETPEELTAIINSSNTSRSTQFLSSKSPAGAMRKTLPRPVNVKKRKPMQSHADTSSVALKIDREPLMSTSPELRRSKRLRKAQS